MNGRVGQVARNDDVARAHDFCDAEIASVWSARRDCVVQVVVKFGDGYALSTSGV